MEAYNGRLKMAVEEVGFSILILLIAVIIGVNRWERLHSKEIKAAEEVWEPPVEIENRETVTEEEADIETSKESAYWFIPQSIDCLISEAEKKQLQSTVLSAADSVKEI